MLALTPSVRPGLGLEKNEEKRGEVETDAVFIFVVPRLYHVYVQ